MNKILVIGNGKSVLDKNYGKIIDEGDWQVVRFNNYQTSGFEKKVGSRTDILARRCCDDVILRPAASLQKVYGFITYCIYSSGMAYVGRDIKAYYGDKCEIVPVKICREIGEKVDIAQPDREWLSVGCLFLGYMSLTNLDFRDRIIIHGFDEPNQKNSHYFPKPPRDSCYHNWQKEHKFIQNLKLQTLEEIVNA
jgi:hypothetical protein